MPDYIVEFYYRDANDATSSKRYSGTFADDAAAQTAADAFLTDAQALTTANIYKMALTKVTLIAGVPGASSNVFERINATVNLNSPNKKANLQIPAPTSIVFDGNNLLTGNALWTAYVANLAPSAWQISDGEHVTGTVRGKRKFVASGNTNIP